MDLQILGIPLSTWLVALALFIGVVLGEPIIRAFIRRRCTGAASSDHTWRGLVGRLNERWLKTTTFVIALAFAVLPMPLDLRVILAARLVVVVAIAFQLMRLMPTLVDWMLLRVGDAHQDEDGSKRAAASTLMGLRWLILALAYSIILLLALQNAGVDVTSLIAGLGIGGVAVALAVQSILGDLFASLTIALDKPFVIGDFIVVGSEMGTVEHIGLKGTRVRSISGEQLVIGNSDLLSSRIRNYKRMNERRVVIGLGVVYATPPDRLELINTIIRGAIEARPNVRFDRCHFCRFGASSLDFEAVYYITSPDYNAHMDAQQAVLLAIARSFQEHGIDFAFPTQTLYIARGESQAPSASLPGA